MRSACSWLGVSHTRVLAWQARAAAGESLEDAASGPAAGEAVHALLDWEHEAIVALTRRWEQVDLTHRKLAHRGSRLGEVYVSESSVLRVLEQSGMRLPGLPRPAPRAKRPFPDWAELTTGVIYCYDFTHFSGLPGWRSVSNQVRSEGMSSIRRRFNQEFKDELCQEVIDTSKPIVEVAKAYGVGPESLRRWLIKYREANGGTEEELSLPERARLKELERENQELKAETAFLKKARLGSKRE